MTSPPTNASPQPPRRQRRIWQGLALLACLYLAVQAARSRTPAETATAPGIARPRDYGVNQVLRYTPSRLDLGLFSAEKPLVRRVEVRNPGPSEVVVQAVQTDSPSTSAHLSSRRLPGGGSSQLEIRVDPQRAPAQLSVSVTISYVGESRVDRLLVRGQRRLP